MTRIRTVVAVGSMALLGVVATGSSALATDGGGSPGKAPTTTAKPVDPAKVARCLGQAGATVTRTKGGGYKIVVPGRKVANAVRACKRYLPPGTAAPTGHGTGTLVIQIGGAPKAGYGTAGEELVQCLTEDGAPPHVVTGKSGTSKSGTSKSGTSKSGAGKSGVAAPSTAVAGDSGPRTVVSGTVGSGTSAKPAEAAPVCASLELDNDVVLESAG